MDAYSTLGIGNGYSITAMRLVLLAAIFACSGAMADGSVLPSLSGTYKVKSPFCTVGGVPDENGEWPQCPPEVMDCLSIEPLSQDSAIVTVISFQTNMHICSASGVATLVSPGLLVIEKPDQLLGNDSVESLDIRYTESSFTIDGPSTLCGARASWGVEFSRRAQVMSHATQCFER